MRVRPSAGRCRTSRGDRSRIIVIAALLPLGGCQGWQSALDTHGPHASALATLFWIFLGILAAVWAITNTVMLFALRRRRPEGMDPLAHDPARERRMTITVASGVAVTAVIVIALTGLSYGAQKALYGHKDGALTLTVTGHQWWWDVLYEDSDPSRSFHTANEIHIPVGEPVLIKLESGDVIHSFWVPSLAGKLDLIPGRQNQIQIQADRPGIYRGQCAEFCGYQHAHMGILVVAEAREDFERWRDGQISAAQPPSDPERQRGQEIFLSKPCVMCHQIRGTSAGGKVAPDLTHVGARRTIAAGALPNSRGNLAAWIVDPQRIKPGAHMPTIKLEPTEIEPVARYLEGLK